MKMKMQQIINSLVIKHSVCTLSIKDYLEFTEINLLLQKEICKFNVNKLTQ